MKIERNDQQRTVLFQDIKQGEVFTDSEGNNVFMKVEEIEDGISGGLVNAVDLIAGEYFVFDDMQKVVPLNAKLIVT